MTDDLTTEIHDAIGFFPSYLEAVGEYNEYQRLAWEESWRVLESNWCDDAGQGVAKATNQLVEGVIAEAAVDMTTPSGESDSAIREAVAYFAFIVFELGLSIATCRYALDGEETRAVHAASTRYEAEILSCESESGDKSGTLPAIIRKGVGTMVPASPELHLIDREVASTDITTTYDRILDALETPNVNNIFRALAVDPDFLRSVVDAQLEIYKGVPSRWRFERQIRNRYAMALAADSNRKAHRPLLRAARYKPATIDEVARRIRLYQENLPTLTVTVLVAAKLLE